MAKFKIRLKVQGLELEVDGEREDIPVIARAVQQQFAGMLEPINVAAGVPKQLPAPAESADGDGSGKSKSRRNRTAARGSTEPENPVEFRHDSAKFGNPIQSWTIAEKCIWLLYVIKNSASVGEVSAQQLVATYNHLFKTAGKLHPPPVTRELSRAKVQNPAPVGEDKNLWYLATKSNRTILVSCPLQVTTISEHRGYHKQV